MNPLQAQSGLNLTGLYSPEFEKENCGFGLIANM
ncbi:Glutamate synthase [NADPH] large chain, partial [hydrothermal vent metagenome]